MSKKTPTTMTRRSLLRQMGLAAAALPFLKYARRAQAAEGGVPRRLILFPSLNGASPEYFWPNPGNLSAMSTITEPLAPYQNQMTFLRRMNIAGSNNHFAVRSMFSGAVVPDYLSPDPTVKSLDQVVADQFQATAPSVKRSLHLGAIPADSIEFYQLYGRSTFFFNPTPVNYEANPVTAFDATFGDLEGGGTPPPTGGGPNYQDQVLGITGAEIDHLQGRVSGSSRESQKLAGHKSALDHLRSGGGDGGGTTVTPASCDASPIASVEALRSSLQGNAAAAYQHQYYDGIMNAQIDILTRAIVCGITRVATLQAGSADGNVTVPIDGGYPHHNTSHGDQLTFARVQQWYAGKFKRLLDALNVPDPLDPAGNTVLHNSCVVWMSECLPTGHGSDDVPCFYVGSAGGALKTGQYFDLAGATNKNVLKTIAQAMGVSDSETSHFGNTALSELKV